MRLFPFGSFLFVKGCQLILARLLTVPLGTSQAFQLPKIYALEYQKEGGSHFIIRAVDSWTPYLAQGELAAAAAVGQGSSSSIPEV